MRLSINLFLGLTAFAVLACQTGGAALAQGADRARYSIIEEPSDRRPGAVTRPANAADRAWRRTRRSPELRSGPLARPSPRYEAPRFDAYGRRRNVRGRPETYDDYGRSRLYLRRYELAPIGPTVRTDAATRINQLAPRR